MNCLFFALNIQVLYWTDDSKETAAGKVRVSGNVTAKNITGLKANTIYFATVRAYNTAGTGPSSTPVNITTKKSRKYLISYAISYTKAEQMPNLKSTYRNASLFYVVMLINGSIIASQN